MVKCRYSVCISGDCFALGGRKGEEAGVAFGCRPLGYNYLVGNLLNGWRRNALGQYIERRIGSIDYQSDV